MKEIVQLDRGDYVTIGAITTYSAKMNIRAKALYSAIAERFEAAGFQKHSGQDNEFKNAKGVFGISVLRKNDINWSMQTFATFETIPTVKFSRVLTPEQILFAGAPEWVVDVRKIYTRHAWTDGEKQYQYFDTPRTNQQAVCDMNRFMVCARKPKLSGAIVDFNPAPIKRRVKVLPESQRFTVRECDGEKEPAAELISNVYTRVGVVTAVCTDDPDWHWVEFRNGDKSWVHSRYFRRVTSLVSMMR